MLDLILTERFEKIEQVLLLGTIIKSFVNDTCPPKIKYWLIVGRDLSNNKLATVYINSKPNEFIKRNALKRQLQFLIPHDDRKLVLYDSYADCSQIYAKSANEIFDLLQMKNYCYKGILSNEELLIILNSMKESPLFSPRDQKYIGAS